MAVVLGLVAGFLVPAIEIGKFIYKPIKLQFSYLCCFNNNVENLRNEARKLEEELAGLQMRVDTEENNGQVIILEVEGWIRDATRTREEVIETENEITNTQNNGSTLKPRYSLSRKVKKTAQAIKELRENCHFDIISHPPPPAPRIPITLGTYPVFESRKDMEEGVMTSLRDNETYRVGICGMGGIGKTTMAKKIMHQAREEHLFEEISMVVVGQTADSLRIQKSLAESLGLKLREESLLARARFLRARLSGSRKKSLIVVDDVWENLNLKEIGIPRNSQCKILLTSRNLDVLKRMNVEKVHTVKELSEKEAWDLFMSYVGSCIEDPHLISIAQEVTEACMGLPIALIVIGTALKGEKEARIWKYWLSQLKSNNPIDLPEILHDVYLPLKMSYDFLENEKAQSLFLLCCLYPKDDDIPLEELAIYATGLHMLTELSLEEARRRVWSLVERLKSRFLLLEGGGKDHVKMHYVVHDVAAFIASDKKLITHGYEENDCNWISPNIGERVEFHVGSRVFPNLHLLWIDCHSRDEELEIDDQFFEGMKQLNVFSMSCPSLQQLPQTTKILINLHTLVLKRCGSLESISGVGELLNLEVLICRHCVSIESLPMEIGKLRRLRLLELSDCYNLKIIAPGIISNLKGLEELIVENCFDGWEGDSLEKEKKNASLSELERLSNLSLVKIKIKDSMFAAQHITLSPNMVEYRIRIGNEPCYFEENLLYEKKMQSMLPMNISLGSWVVEGFRSVKGMHLEGAGSSLDFEVSHNIKVLVLRGCSTVKKLVSMKTTTTVFPLLEVLVLEKLNELKEICLMDGPMPSNSLSNLKELRLECLPALEHLNAVLDFNKISSIYIRKCHRLQSLFSSLMITRGDSSLIQLKSLEIHSCDMMEQVFSWNHEENQIQLVFPNLKLLQLKYLPRLTSFIKGKGIESTEFPVLEEMRVEDCAIKSFVSIGSSTTCPHHDDDDAVCLICKPNKGFNRMKSLFSSTMGGRCLSQLKELEISGCPMMEEVILWNEEENPTNIHITQLPNLKLLIIDTLPKLTSLSKGIQFTPPAEMKIRNCPLLESCGSTTSHDSIHLFCKTHKVEFNSLKILEIGGYDGMWRNWCPAIGIFSGLSELSIINVDGVKSLFSCSVAQNLLNMKCLYIDQCLEMVQVIEDDSYSPIHVFPSLKELHLSRLPELKSICESSSALEFPSLTVLRISECKLMEKFTSGLLNTPKLECMYIERDDSLGVNCSKERRNGTGRLVGSSVEIIEEEGD